MTFSSDSTLGFCNLKMNNEMTRVISILFKIPFGLTMRGNCNNKAFGTQKSDMARFECIFMTHLEIREIAKPFNLQALNFVFNQQCAQRKIFHAYVLINKCLNFSGCCNIYFGAISGSFSSVKTLLEEPLKYLKSKN